MPGTYASESVTAIHQRRRLLRPVCRPDSGRGDKAEARSLYTQGALRSRNAAQRSVEGGTGPGRADGTGVPPGPCAR